MIVVTTIYLFEIDIHQKKYYLFLEIDGTNRVFERNEENNIAQNISSALIRHYEQVNDISGIHINAYHVNSDNANNQNNHSMHWIEAALREGITRA